MSESKKRSKQRKESAKPDKIKEEVGEINDGEDGEVEEGEISSSNEPSDDGKSESSRDSGGENCETGESSEDDEEFPPCIRAIVLESCSTEVKKGSLGGIITCMGGTLGRDGDNHAIILPDMSVEKVLMIHYSLYIARILIFFKRITKFDSFMPTSPTHQKIKIGKGQKRNIL